MTIKHGKMRIHLRSGKHIDVPMEGFGELQPGITPDTSTLDLEEAAKNFRIAHSFKRTRDEQVRFGTVVLFTRDIEGFQFI